MITRGERSRAWWPTCGCYGRGRVVFTLAVKISPCECGAPWEKITTYLAEVPPELQDEWSAKDRELLEQAGILVPDDD